MVLSEMLRKLTAAYSEEEYKEWLMEKPMTEEEYDTWADKKPDGIDDDVAAAEINYNKRQSRLLSRFGKINFKDKDEITEALHKVAKDTGYECHFLLEVFVEGLMDGQTARESFIDVAMISYEQDW